MIRIVCLLIGYVFGLIQTGYFIGKLNHEDIREHGSGNAGSTNALRVYGVKAGVLTLLGDVLKAVASVLLVKLLFREKYPDCILLLEMYAGAGTILGHNFPFYMGFRGGKGVASSLGILFAIDWKLAVIGLAVFICVTIFSHYVSLGSLTGYVSALVCLIVFGQLGFYHMEQKYLTEMYLLFGAMTLLAFVRHRKNIVRLLNGTENRLSIGSREKHEGESGK